MSDSVKHIFKTLIKVPIIIVVFYAVFNLFAFGVSYMKMLGLSYIVMQTAMENNFIPPTEQGTIENYMQDSLETEMLQSVSFTPSTTFVKGQYGEEVTVGVQAHYQVIWPLMPKETIHEEFEGLNGTNYGGSKSNAELNDIRDKTESNRQSNIVIEYKVPGLKYYSDLDN